MRKNSFALALLCGAILLVTTADFAVAGNPVIVPGSSWNTFGKWKAMKEKGLDRTVGSSHNSRSPSRDTSDARIAECKNNAPIRFSVTNDSSELITNLGLIGAVKNGSKSALGTLSKKFSATDAWGVVTEK